MTETCQKIRDQLDDALDARLAPGARSAFDAHVGRCGGCAAEWELAVSLRSSLLRIGLEPAPGGLRESIAAEVRRTAIAPAEIPARTGAARRFTAPAYARAAAAVLVVVTIGWLGWRLGAPAIESGSPGHFEHPGPLVAEVPKRQEPAPRATTASVSMVWNLEPARFPTDANLLFYRDERTTTALINAREIAAGGPGAVDELNRIVTASATPEDRLRQAEVLTLLDDNMPAIAEAAGEAPALSKLGRDADETLSVFSGSYQRADSGDKKAAGVLREAQATERTDDLETKDKAAEAESALKVVRPSAGVPASKAEQTSPAPGTAPLQPREPAFYMVSGPGAIARVERVLADKSLRFHQVWLTDRSQNEKARKLEDQEAEYRIVEVEVPEGAFDETIGELESLVGLRLAPVGRLDVDLAPRGIVADGRLAGQPKAPGGRGGVGGAAARAPAESRPPVAEPTGGDPAGKPKSLSIRKLRLVLIGR